MQAAYKMLSFLQDGEVHSGIALAKCLGISHSNVWKAIQFLRKLGVPLQAVSGRGYRWHEPLELLDQSLIIPTLSAEARSYLSQIHLLPLVASTNDYLMQRISNLKTGAVCIAEAQTHGKGRQGKKWFSPYGLNIYFSLYHRFSTKLTDLSGLSLVVALAVLNALSQIAPLPPGLGIKWPNDIWFENKKLAGILIETHGRQETTHAVIGVGLNVCSSLRGHEETGSEGTDIRQIFSFVPSRNQLLGYVLNALTLFLALFQQKGFAAFQPSWTGYDLLRDKEVQLKSQQGIQVGCAEGVNDRGELCVRIDGILKAIRHGEISVRPQK